MKFFSKKRFSKGWFTGLVLGVASSAAVVYATVVTVPNTFTSGQTISAAEMNANFTAIASCPTDMVAVGSFCIDKYEASVWDGPTGPGTDTQLANGAGCQANGNDCSAVGPLPSPIYALSVINVPPAGGYTWFQAQQACANVGKRLPTNAEWQMAAAGTPDDTTCNIDSTGAVANTNDNPMCVSNFGVINMTGNVWEWVAEWIQGRGTIPGVVNNTGLYGGDANVDIGAAQMPGGGNGQPAALLRGGALNDGVAGIFTIAASEAPAQAVSDFGFRCAR